MGTHPLERPSTLRCDRAARRRLHPRPDRTPARPLLLDRQKATIEDLKLQIGTALLPVYSGFLSFLAEGLKAVGNLLTGHLSLWQKLAYLASYAQGAAGAETRIYLNGLKAAKESIEDVTLAAPKLGAGLGTAMDEATTSTKKATTAAEKYRDTLSGMLSLFQKFSGQ